MNHTHHTRNNGRGGAANDENALPTMGQIMGALGRLTEVVEQTVNLNQTEANRRVGQPQRHDPLDNFLKKNPPSFDGAPNPMLVTSWKDKLERIFEAMVCTDAEKVRFAVFMLEGEAANWWRVTKARFEREETEITWTVFCLAFDSQYFSDAVKDKLEKEFHDLVQGENSVAEYEAKFTALIRYAEDIANNEGRKARRFVQGLKAQLQEKMAINRYDSFDLAVQHATNLESNLPSVVSSTGNVMKRQREDNDDPNNGFNDKRPMWNHNQNQGGQQRTQFESLCSTCNRRHHGACTPYCTKCNNRHLGECYPICPRCNKRHTGVCQKTNGACFNCGDTGHHMRFCNKPRKSDTRGVGSHNQNSTRNRPPGL